MYAGERMAHTYTVTASTSVVLIDTLQSPNTIVYVSSVAYPGHIVGVRYTSSATDIAKYPIVVSTTKGVSFYDGTFSTLINQPFGSVSMASRGPRSWQLLNNQAFNSLLSNASVNSVSSTWAFITTVSSIFEATSTIKNVDVINILKNFVALGETNFRGDITVGNTGYFYSSITTEGSLNVSTGISASGPVNIFNQLFVGDGMTVKEGGLLNGNLTIDGGLLISSSVYLTEGAILARNFSTQQIITDSFSVAGGTFVGGNISVGTTVAATQNTAVSGGLYIAGDIATTSYPINVASNLLTKGNVLIDSAFARNTRSLYEVYTSTITASGGISSLRYVNAASSISVRGATSIRNNIFVSSQLNVINNAKVSGSASFSSLAVSNNADIGGNLTISNDITVSSLATDNYISLSGNLYVNGSTFLQGALFTSTSMAVFGDLSTTGALTTISDMNLGNTLQVGGNLTVGGYLSAINAHVGNFLYVGSNLAVGGIFSTGSISATTQNIKANGFTARSFITTSSLFTSILGTQIPQLDGSVYVATEKFYAPDFSSLNLVVGQRGYIGSTIFVRDSLITPYLETSSIVDYGAILAIGDRNAYTKNRYTFDEIAYTYAGSTQTFYVPDRVTKLFVYMWGAGGGGCGQYQVPGLPTAGAGAFLKGILTVTPNETLDIIVGGPGVFSGTDRVYGGGGAGSIDYSGDPKGGSSGGGRSAIQRGGQDIVTAGGGGGAALAHIGVGGKATYSGSASSGGGDAQSGGGGGTQTGGGAGGVATTGPDGGVGDIYSGGNGLAGGGGGYYGGGGSAYNDQSGAGGGGGGSSYVSDPSFELIYGYNSVDGTSPPGANLYEYGANGSNAASGGKPFQDGGPGLVVIQPYYNIYELFSTTLSGPYVTVSSIFESTITTAGVNDLFTSTNTNVFGNNITATQFFGDGSLLSNLSNYSPNLNLNNLTINETYTTSKLKADSVLVSTLGVIWYGQIGGTKTDGTYNFNISSIFFRSTSELVIGVGQDRNQNNIIQNLGNTGWKYANKPMFDGAGMSVATNSNADTPFFVAVGQSQDPLRTILWSVNGSNWNNIQSGGFNRGGGNDVVYAADLSLWVAVGEDTNATIQYSQDGLNWIASVNGFLQTSFPNNHNFVRWNYFTQKFVACKDVPNLSPGYIGTQLKVSSDGIYWNDIVNLEDWYSGTEVGYLFTFFAGGVLGFGRMYEPYTGQIFDNVWFLVVKLGSSFDNNFPLVFHSFDGTTWYFNYDDYFNIFYSQFINRLSLSWIPDLQLWYMSGTSFYAYTTTFFSPDFYNWTAINGGPDIPPFASFAYDANLQILYAGAQIENAPILYTMINNDISTFVAVESIGFSSGIIQYGFPTGIFTAPNIFSGDTYPSNVLFAFGTQSPDGASTKGPAIIQMTFSYNGEAYPYGYPQPVSFPQYSYTSYNLSNSFSSLITSMAYGPTASNFTIVATGDSKSQQQTIMHASNLNLTAGGSNTSLTLISTFYPALVGGFSTIGYGVTYYNPPLRDPVWLAVGDANIPFKTIQSSKDSINWYAVGTDKAVRTAARGITWGNFQGEINKILVVGSDPVGNRCILVGNDSYTDWQSTIGRQGYFSGSQANAALLTPDFALIGGNTSVNYPYETIQVTSDLKIWSYIKTGGFSKGAYGFASKTTPYPFVAGGYSRLGNIGTDTIKYSYDGNIWYPAFNGMSNGVNSITWVDYLQTYFAGGSYGMASSKDGKYWYPVSTLFTADCWWIDIIQDTQSVPMLWATGYQTSMYANQGPFMISYDGILWSTINNPFYQPVVNATQAVKPTHLRKFNENYYLGSEDTGSDGNFPGEYTGAVVRYSPDLITWYDTNLTPYAYARLQCYGLETGFTDTGIPILLALVASGIPYNNNYALYYTTGGFDFSEVTTPYNGPFSGIYFCQIKWAYVSGKKWVAARLINPGQMWYSDNGFEWYYSQTIPGFTPAFQGSLQYNNDQQLWYCVGTNSSGNGGAIVTSPDGQNWTLQTTDALDTLSSITNVNAIATTGKVMPSVSSIIVAVGDNGEAGNFYNSVQYSYDGGLNFNNAPYLFGGDPLAETFTKGTGVTYNQQRSTFIVTGQNTRINNGSVNTNDLQIAESVDGMLWFNTGETQPFLNNIAVGVTRGLVAQSINRKEQLDTMTISTFTIYNRSKPFDAYLGANTLRTTSTYMTFDETLFINLSTQVNINTDTSYPGAALTVNGATYASSIIVTGASFTLANNFTVSSLNVSSLILNSSIVNKSIKTPYLGLSQDSYTGFVPSPNTIQQLGGGGLLFNNMTILPSNIGINGINVHNSLNVNGSLGAQSTMIDNIFTVTSSIHFAKSVYNSNLLAINSSFAISKNRQPGNTLYGNTGGLSFNDLMFVTLSSQKVGIGTSTPQYSFDVQYPAIFTNLLSSPITTIGALRPSIQYF